MDVTGSFNVNICFLLSSSGFFKDYTGGYDAAFWISGALITISAILCYPLSYVKKMETKKLEELKNGKSLA